MSRILICISAAVSTMAIAQPPAVPSTTPSASSLDIAAKLLPDGTYQRMMGGTMSKLMDGLAGQMTNLPMAPFLKSAGLPEGETAKLGGTTIKEILAIVDPALQQRMQVTMPIMLTEMGKVLGRFEPQLREGFAEAYSRHFTPTQLEEIDRFLNTPSDAAFAAQSMTIASDPALVQRMQAIAPALAQAMPAIMQKASAATAGLPKAKTVDTLTDDDRARIAKLLGIDLAKLRRS